MRIVFLLLLFCFCFRSTFAQSTDTLTKKKNGGKDQVVSAGLLLPFGEFSDTHLVGLGLEWSWSDHRFGILSSIPSKKTGFMATGGIAYYVGKKETVSGYPYKYPAFIFMHAYPGMIYNADKKISVVLAGGPGLGIYNGTTRFNLGLLLQGNYAINEKIAVGPGIIMMKESGADPLGVISLKVDWAF